MKIKAILVSILSLIWINLNAQVVFDTIQIQQCVGQPHYLFFADMDLNGHDDILVQHQDVEKISIYYIGEDGYVEDTLILNSVAHTTYSGATLVVEDFNNDKLPDIAVTNSDGHYSTPQYAVFLNQGSKSFSAYSMYSSYGWHTFNIDSGDLNNDGFEDLVLSSCGKSRISVNLNDGDGTFSAGIHAGPTAYSEEARNPKIVDINGDGNLDVLVAIYKPVYGVEIYLGAGDGTLVMDQTVFAGEMSGNVRKSFFLTDYDNDNDIDILSRKGDSIAVAFNNGSGGFSEIGFSDGRIPMHVFDWNRDGYDDIVTAEGTIFINDQDGFFSDTIDTGVGMFGISTGDIPYYGDLNADLKMDILYSDIAALQFGMVLNKSEDDCITYCDTVMVYDTTIVMVFDTTFVTIRDTVVTQVVETEYVTVYDSISVSDTLIIDAVLTGMNPPDNINTLKVYPNPARDHIFINTGNYARMAAYQLKIIDQQGAIVFETNVEEALYELNLSGWSGMGLYYLQLIDPGNQIIESRKIILQ